NASCVAVTICRKCGLNRLTRARSRTRVNFGSAFQLWRELKEWEVTLHLNTVTTRPVQSFTDHMTSVQ
uniref:Uncharacterized protein n=1 Tax=Cyprinus carpio TaxID=7962 RepID=A0A8C1IG87_CYPCA